MPNFTTGPATLPDVGTLSYNGCIFSPLFETQVSGKVVQDAAGRTTKFMEYKLTADGYVTFGPGIPIAGQSIAPTMALLRKLLSAQAGVLVYQGRGFDLVVNSAKGFQDVAWGPVPELIEFQPLGGGLSAKIKWSVTTRVPEIAQGGIRNFPTVLQFNNETSVTYSEDGYSTLSIKGTLEIPLTRIAQGNRTVPNTVDSFRQPYLDSIANSIDLSRYRVTKREFPVSRDRRTMEWSFVAEELPYMDLPPNVTIARGSYDVRPAKTGMGLATWICSLRVTYTVRKDKRRREAWLAFLALLRLRMSASAEPNSVIPPPEEAARLTPLGRLVFPGAGIAGLFGGRPAAAAVVNSRRAWLIDFTFNEGMYLDSKTVTFSASWRLVTAFQGILLASGLWRKLPEEGTPGDPSTNLWAANMRDVEGWASWSRAPLDALQDVVVDFGGI